jgi:WD40 repeat protein
VGDDKTIRLWDLKSTKEIRHLDGHTDLVMSVAFAPDGRILSGSLDKTVRLWDRESGEQLVRFEGFQGGVKCVACSGDGRYILSGGMDKAVRLGRLPPPDVLGGKPDDPTGEARVFQGHTKLVRRVAISFDGRHVLSAGHDNTARVWQTATGRELLAFKGHTNREVHSAAFLPDGRHALSSGDDNLLRLWDVTDGHEIRRFEGQGAPVHHLAVSPDGRQALSCHPTNGVLLWDLETGTIISRLANGPDGAEYVSFSADGRLGLSGGTKGVCVWDLKAGEQVQQFKGHTAGVMCVAFSLDGRFVLSGSRDKTVRLWDVETGQEVQRFEGHTSAVWGVAPSPDGRRVISASLDRTVRLWDAETGKELERFEGHTDGVMHIAFSPDARYALTGSMDKTMRLWRLPFAPLVFGRPLQIQASPKLAPVAARLTVPDEADQKKAVEDIRDIYQDDYKNLQPDELSCKLLKRGQNSQEEPGRRFVYLREARDRAAQAGDFALCFRIIDEMTKTFAVEEMPMKVAAVQNAAKAARTLSASKALLETVLSLLTDSIQSDDYDSAEPLAKAAEAIARQTGSSPKSFQLLSAEVKRLQKEFVNVKPALAKLAAEPKDAEANRIVGSFRCFEKGDWERGLPLLALSDKAKLKELAAKDLAAPKTPDAREAVGSGWWTLAKQQKGPAKAIVQERACYWYGLVLPEAVGNTRDRLEKGIRLHNRDYPAVAWGQLDISEAAVNLGVLHLGKEKKIITRQSYSGPIEITALARTEKNNIRFGAGKGAAIIFNWENKPEELRVTRPDGTDQPESGSLATAALKPLQPNTWYHLSWRLTEEGMTVSINGRAIFTEKHKNDLSAKQPIRLYASNSEIEVLSFTVRPLKKKP